MSNPITLSKTTCLLAILVISLTLLGPALDLGESALYTLLLAAVVLLLLFYDENDRLEHEKKLKRCLEPVRLVKARGLVVDFALAVPLLLVLSTPYGEYTITEIIHPFFLISICILEFTLFMPGIIARFRYNRKIKLGRIIMTDEIEISRKPGEPLGVLFGPGEENGDKADANQ